MTDPIVETLGLTVRQARLELGLSQEQLAERSELNRSYVGEIERGRAVASIVTLQKLAAALETSSAALLARCDHLARQRHGQYRNLAAIAC